MTHISQPSALLTAAIHSATDFQAGTIQNLTGIKAAATITVINKDGETPTFGVTDFRLVGRLSESIPGRQAALG